MDGQTIDLIRRLFDAKIGTIDTKIEGLSDKVNTFQVDNHQAHELAKQAIKELATKIEANTTFRIKVLAITGLLGMITAGAVSIGIALLRLIG